jgi:hypothetical protein
MTTNRIEVQLDGRDGISSKLTGIKRNIDAIGPSASSIGLAVAGWTAGISLAQGAIAKLTGSFMEAARTQGDQIATASTFAAVTGQSFGEAKQFVKDFNKEITIMANDLPGTAQQYKVIANAISDNLVTAFKDPKGKLNVAPFKATLLDLAGSFGALADSTGVDAFSTADSLARLLDGQTNALKLIFFDKNPVVKNLLNEELKRQNKTLTDWTKLDLKQRAQILRTVAGKTLTEDMKKASSATFSAVTGTIQSQLFDPESGIFGFMRDLGKDRTAISEITTAITEVTKLFNEIGKTLTALGLDLPDPMLTLANGVRWFTNKIKYVSSVFQRLRGDLSQLDRGVALGNFMNNLRFGLGQLFSNLTQMITSIDTSQVASILTGAVVGFFKLLPDLINGVTGLINLSAGAGAKIGAAINWGAIGASISEALTRIDWGQLGLSLIAVNAASRIPGLLWGGITAGLSFLSNALMGAIVTRIPFVISIVGASINTIGALLGKTLLLAANPVVALGAIAAAVIIPVATQYVQHWDEVKLVIGSWLGNAATWLQINIVFPFRDGLTALSKLLTSAWKGLESLFTSLWGGVTSAVQGFVSGIQNAINAVRNLIPGQGSTPAPAATPTPTAMVPSTSAAAYNGWIPNAASGFNLGGLWGAVRREIANKPPGSRLLVANTSETVLTRNQARSLRAALASPRTNAGAFAPNINVYGAPGQDATAIADEVMRRIASEWRSYQNTRLVVG